VVGWVPGEGVIRICKVYGDDQWVTFWQEILRHGSNLQTKILLSICLFVCLSGLILGNGQSHHAEIQQMGVTWSNLDF
jgi:hypothetical protein